MPLIITAVYFLLIIIFLAIGGAIVFHLLFYKINRHVSGLMFLIYLAGVLFLLISNFILFRQVNWYQIFSGFNF